MHSWEEQRAFLLREEAGRAWATVTITSLLSQATTSSEPVSHHHLALVGSAPIFLATSEGGIWLIINT